MQLIFLLFVFLNAFPNICDVVNAPSFKSNLQFNHSLSVCGFPPRPCADISYYVPKYFIEVLDKGIDSFFISIPTVEFQLSNANSLIPQGVEDDHGSFSYEAHTIRVPFSNFVFGALPCKGVMPDLMCLTTMSEHISDQWKSGTSDLLQPKWLLWTQAPKLCLAKGTLASISGSFNLKSYGKDAGICSYPANLIPTYPPSIYPVCTGWGIHFPRTGTVTSSDPITASLMIASRIKSIGSEVLQSFQSASSFDEKWQMILPQASSSFKEGQGIQVLQALGVNELGRLNGIPKGYLYAIWQKTSCTVDLPWILASKGIIESLILSCKSFKKGL